MRTTSSSASAAVPRLAVSVLMVRGDEIFIQNRTHTMDFAAGVVVFPGGRVDTIDKVTTRTHPVPAPLLEVHARCWAETSVAAGTRSDTADAAAVLLAAAVREVHEETGAMLAPQDLTPWANWITPASYGKRFDTYFYLTVLPQSLTSRRSDAPVLDVPQLDAPTLDPQHLTTEAYSSHWSPVRGLLAEAAAGKVELMRPTEALLQELADLPGSLPVAIQSVLKAPRRITPVGHL